MIGRSLIADPQAEQMPRVAAVVVTHRNDNIPLQPHLEEVNDSEESDSTRSTDATMRRTSSNSSVSSVGLRAPDDLNHEDSDDNREDTQNSDQGNGQTNDKTSRNEKNESKE